MPRQKIKTPTALAVERALNNLLEGAYWIPTLKPNEVYSRVHDDCDGDPSQELSVIIGPDSDAYITLPDTLALRFRSYFGGGMSLRTRNALLLLAEAIRRDNEERPQRFAVSQESAKVSK